jgi:serine/threonine protein kinase
VPLKKVASSKPIELSRKSPLSPHKESPKKSPVSPRIAVISKKHQGPSISYKDFLPLRKLGRGSFGDVYLVKHLPTGTLYAMKTLAKRSISEGNNWLRYVKTERDVLVGSTSQFINKINYAFQTEKKLFLILDFCPGGDLETLMSSQDQPLSEN